MPSIKRSISPVELDAPRKTRSTRKPAAGVSTPSTSTSLVSPDVQALQSQFEELQSFVLSQDLLHKTSPSTRKHVDLHPDAAKSHANIVRGLIDEKILAIENDSPNRIDQTEKRDAAMLEYIPEVGRLAEMPGGLQLACDLLIYLSAQSYCHKNFDQDKNDRTRPSDSSADVLLLHILERLHEEDKIFLVSKYLDVLEPHVKFFEQKEARPYLEQSFGRLSSWNKGSGIAQRTYERLRKEIVAMRGGLDNACSKHHIPTKVWYARTLVSRCEEFLPKIRRLGNLENGLLLAFDLFLFLSRQSYFESGVVEPWLQQLKPHDTFIDILDDMLMETAVRIREADPDFQPEDALEKLQGEVEYWDTILEEECLVDSFRILSSWIPLSAKKWAKEKHDEIQADILKEQRRIEKRYRNCRDDGRAPVGDWLSTAMDALSKESHFLGLSRLAFLWPPTLPSILRTIITAKHLINLICNKSSRHRDLQQGLWTLYWTASSTKDSTPLAKVWPRIFSRKFASQTPTYEPEVPRTILIFRSRS